MKKAFIIIWDWKNIFSVLASERGGIEPCDPCSNSMPSCTNFATADALFRTQRTLGRELSFVENLPLNVLEQ